MNGKMKKRLSITFLVMAMILLCAQAGIWGRSTRNAGSESEKISMVSSHPPREAPGLVGMLVLTLAAVIASVPAKSGDHHPGHSHP